MRHRTGRRTRPRVPFQGSIELFHDGECFEADRGCDLSEGGLGVRRLQVPLHTPLKVFIALPESSGSTRTVMLEGEVAWRRLSKSGVRFVTPPPPAVRSFIYQNLAA